jgi:flagellar basal-body rod modification protein FlgD
VIAPVYNPVVGSTGVGEAQGSATLGKDEFLKLLVAQMRNQDPMSPSDPQEMAAQLAQFSSVEQLVNINEQLGTQATSADAMALALNNSSAVAIIGKDVLSLGNTVDVTGSGGDSITVGVGGIGGSAAVTLYDADGLEVGSLDLGAIGGGRQEIPLDSVTSGLPAGRYTYELTVTNSQGDAVDVQTFMRARVDGVRYGANGPVLFSGTEEISLADVVEIISQ